MARLSSLWVRVRVCVSPPLHRARVADTGREGNHSCDTHIIDEHWSFRLWPRTLLQSRSTHALFITLHTAALLSEAEQYGTMTDTFKHENVIRELAVIAQFHLLEKTTNSQKVPIITDDLWVI